MDSIIQIPNFVENSEEIFGRLRADIPWEYVNYFKRKVNRYDGGLGYLNALLARISREFGRNILGAFLNFYETGNDYAPYHADKYGTDCVLLSFGEPRILRYKHNTSKETKDFILGSGDILFLPEETNKNWKHSLLKRTRLQNPRISILVFLENK